MAEFQEVMKHAYRMHEFYRKSGGCLKDCPLNKGSLGCGYYMMRYPQKTENIVVQWAKEHPVKTNADKFKEMFGIEIVPTTGCSFIACEVNNCDNCEYKDFWNKEYKEPRGAKWN